MKKVYIAVAAAWIGSATVGASTDEVCKSVGDLAQQSMINKQLGVPMSAMMASMATVYQGGALEVMQKMIVDAYSSPDFSTDNMKKKQVVEFRNRNELGCYVGIQAGD